MSQRDIGREAPAPQNGNASAPALGYSLGIQRLGSTVHVTLTAGNEYLAIELFDRLVESAQAGQLRLDVSGESDVSEEEGSLKGRPEGGP